MSRSTETRVEASGVVVRIPAGQVQGDGTLRLTSATTQIPTLELVSAASSPVSVKLEGTTLVKSAELSFPVPAEWKPELVPVVIWEDGSGGWRWLPTSVSSNGGRRTANARTDHFSSGFLAGVDPSRLAADLANSIKNFFIGRSGVPDPTCPNSDAVSARVKVSSDNGDAVKWCIGVQDGKTVLKIANNRRTYTQLEMPPDSTVTGREWGISFDKLRRWAGERLVRFGEALPPNRQLVLIDPGETVTIVVPDDASDRILASGSGVALLFQALLEGVGMYFTVAKAAALPTTYQAGALQRLLGSGDGSNAASKPRGTAWTPSPRRSPTTSLGRSAGRTR